MAVYAKNVWLDSKGAQLLEEARKHYISDSKDRPTDINVLTRALEVYVNDRTRQRNRADREKAKGNEGEESKGRS